MVVKVSKSAETVSAHWREYNNGGALTDSDGQFELGCNCTVEGCAFKRSTFSFRLDPRRTHIYLISFYHLGVQDFKGVSFSYKTHDAVLSIHRH